MISFQYPIAARYGISFGKTKKRQKYALCIILLTLQKTPKLGIFGKFLKSFSVFIGNN